MIIKHEALSQQGQGRANNEDCYCVLPEQDLYIVSDGMGGHNAGEVASRLAVDTCAAYLTQNSDTDEADALLERAIAAANEKIYADSNTSEEHRNMGATLAMVWRKESLLYVAHVGDSRVYVFNSEQARALTDDHSVVGEMVREGLISPEQAINHPKKNILTRALGVEESVSPDISAFELPIPGYLLLCSDGISAYLPMEKLLPTVAAKVKPCQMLPVLAELAKEAGSRDDITGVLLWEEDEPAADEGEIADNIAENNDKYLNNDKDLSDTNSFEKELTEENLANGEGCANE